MRDFAKVSPQIWTNEIGREIKILGRDAQVLSFYFQTNPYANMAGIYYLPVVLMAHETGMSLEDISKAMAGLCEIGYCSYDFKHEYVWVHEMAIDQICAQLKPTDNRVKAINSIFAALPKLPFLQSYYEQYADAFYLDDHHHFDDSTEDPLEPLPSKEKKKENENNKEKKTLLSGTPDIVDEEQLFSSEKHAQQIDEKRQSSSHLSQAKEILSFLNKKSLRNYRAEDSNLKLIISRLKSGASVDDCRAVIARKYRDWHDTDMQKYLRPATIFNATKFEQYLGECVEVNADTDEKSEEGSMDEAK